MKKENYKKKLSCADYKCQYSEIISSWPRVVDFLIAGHILSFNRVSQRYRVGVVYVSTIYCSLDLPCVARCVVMRTHLA